jgi:hypothetical protein
LKNEIAVSSNALDDSTRCQLNYSSKNDSAVSSNVESSSDVESRHQSLDQLLETNSNASFEELKNYQLNATIATPCNLRIFQMFKEAQQASLSDSELDSDDLSNDDESCDIRNNKLADEPMSFVISELPKEDASVSVMSKLPNDVIKDSIPIFNDCGVESDDSDLDAFGEPQHFSFLQKFVE